MFVVGVVFYLWCLPAMLLLLLFVLCVCVCVCVLFVCVFFFPIIINNINHEFLLKFSLVEVN